MIEIGLLSLFALSFIVGWRTAKLITWWLSRE